jgi:hypothetical protein
MEKFSDVLSRWKARQLSGQEAGEILGCSKRQFRRYRQRYEEEGLEGLFDKRLGEASDRRVPINKVAWVLRSIARAIEDGPSSTSTNTCRSSIISAGATPG